VVVAVMAAAIVASWPVHRDLTVRAVCMLSRQVHACKVQTSDHNAMASRRLFLAISCSTCLSVAAAAPQDAVAVEDGADLRIPSYAEVITRGRKLKPQLGVKRTNLQLFEGRPADDGTRDIVAELQTSSGSRVLTTFTSNWPQVPSTGGDNIEVKKQQSGEAAFVQVLPSVGVQTAGNVSNKAILDAVLGSMGKFGANGKPERVQVISSVVSSPDQSGGPERKLLTVRFSALSPRAVEVETRALISVIVAGGDAFMLVGVCREGRWQRGSSKLLTAVVESFRARESGKN